MELDDETRRRRGASFDRAAAVYEASRPGYPSEAVAWGLGGPPAVRDVVDLAAGTGKLTRELVAQGFAVTAVDPSPAMLSQLRAALPDVEARPGSAEVTGLDGASADAVTIASALHWFTRPDADEEIARVLRPGGRVVTFGSRRSSSDAVAVAFEQATRLVRGETGPPPPHGPPSVFDERWFGPTEVRSFPYAETVDAERFVGMLASRSYVIDMSDAERTVALSQVADVAASVGLVGDATAPMRFECIVQRSFRA